MKILLLTLISAFVLGNILTEWRNRKMLPWTQNPISAYLADVPWAWMQDLGFFALASALFLMGDSLSPAGMAFVVAGLALILVVVTKYYIAFSNASAIDKTEAEKIHIICAGIAFTGITVAMLMETWHTGDLAKDAALAAPGVAFLFYRFQPQKLALEEKFVGLCLMVSLYARLVT